MAHVEIKFIAVDCKGYQALEPSVAGSRSHIDRLQRVIIPELQARHSCSTRPRAPHAMARSALPPAQHVKGSPIPLAPHTTRPTGAEPGSLPPRANLLKTPIISSQNCLRQTDLP